MKELLKNACNLYEKLVRMRDEMDDMVSSMEPMIRELGIDGEVTRMRKAAKAEEEVSEEDRDLYELLRRIRMDVARDAGWPPYCIMSNKALREVVARKPTTVGEFGEIPGISARRRDESGELFVAAILEYMAEK